MNNSGILTDEIILTGLDSNITNLKISDFESLSEGSSIKQKFFRFSQILPIVGIMFAIATNPATAIQNYGYFDQKRRDSATISWTISKTIGIPISHKEALLIADKILARAERERYEIVEKEAKIDLSRMINNDL